MICLFSDHIPDPKYSKLQSKQITTQQCIIKYNKITVEVYLFYKIYNNLLELLPFDHTDSTSSWAYDKQRYILRSVP